jgi:hypothetical protein
MEDFFESVEHELENRGLSEVQPAPNMEVIKLSNNKAVRTICLQKNILQNIF